MEPRSWPAAALVALYHQRWEIETPMRLAMADATSTQPGIDPDRASFTIALQAARDQLIQAAGVLATTSIDLLGKIGRAVLDTLLADRRLRISPRAIKRATPRTTPEGPTSTGPATRRP